ncbi:MAG TPA: hypothetical protein VME43_19010 [Bryobacteraceae bacterium]|nr:hypothetical protein [Bryobacteraceae bacterium]
MKAIAAFAVLFAFAAPCQVSREAGRTGSRTGLLETNTLFAVYGRGFNIAPILGRLGTYKDIDAMASDTRSWVKRISAVTEGKGVVTGIHLIYALAVPCTGKGDCLDYLSGDIVGKYIKPAAERGWVVILDTQLGRSDPMKQVNRMIADGYLKYENVHVAIDPEFHTRPAQLVPGIPIGTVTASQINKVQQILDSYVESQNLKTKKILIVHQFGDATVHDGVPFMIQDKKALRDFADVELVIDADGLGSPFLKVRKYNLMTNSRAYPFIRFRAIKIFFPNPWEKRGHFDKPPMTVDEIFGLRAVPGGLRIAAKPNVVIIA